MSYTVENRNGVHVLIGTTGCRPATEAEVYFVQRCRELEAQCDTLHAEVERTALAAAQGGVITHTNNELITKCQESLPRNEFCELKAVPKQKNMENIN